jgi:serine/threonine protein kinase
MVRLLSWLLPLLLRSALCLTISAFCSRGIPLCAHIHRPPTQYKKIDKSYHVKISDFGLSILKPQRISRLRGERVGTLTTMAPEILKGSNYNEKAGTRVVQRGLRLSITLTRAVAYADVYSFSMLLWQIYTCERLYSDLEYTSYPAVLFVFKGAHPILFRFDRY